VTWSKERLALSLGRNRENWDALNEAKNGGHPLLDSRFVNSLLEYFGSGNEHLFCFRGRDGFPQNMLILQRHRIGVWQSFVPSQAQISPALVSSPESMMALPGGWVLLNLMNLDPMFSGSLDAWQRLPAIESYHATTMRICVTNDFDEYWAQRSKNLRKNVRRWENRMVRSELIPSLSVVSDPGEIPNALDRYADLEVAGWKGTAGTAIQRNTVQAYFYSQMLKKFAESGQAAIYEYRLGEHLAASRLTVSSKNMVVILKTAYDEKKSDFAPGRMLLKELIAQMFRTSKGVDIEFYTDATEEQLAWGTSNREIRHMAVLRNPLMLKVYDLMRRRGRLSSVKC